MFTIARYIVQHKVGAAAVLALGVFFLTPSAKDEAPKSNNPWAAQAQEAPASIGTVASTEEKGFVEDMMDEASNLLDEAGINPVSQVEENAERLEGAADALNDANR